MFSSGMQKTAMSPLSRLLVASAAPAVGAVGGALAHKAVAKSKGPKDLKYKSDRELAIQTGSLLGTGVALHQAHKVLSGALDRDGKDKAPHKAYPGQKHDQKPIKLPESAYNKYKKAPHPNITRKRGNVIHVDFNKKPGFIAGLTKVLPKKK